MSRRKPLIDLCKTRWAERHSVYKSILILYQAYKFIVIALGLHREDLSSNFSEAPWDADSKTNANSLLHGVITFEFIVVCLIVYQYLSYLAGITACLAH